MINITNFVLLSLVVFAACADNNEPDKRDNAPVITPRGIQKPKQTEQGNSFTTSISRGPGLHSSRSNVSNITTYNNSNNTGHTVYVQGGVTLDFKGNAVSINGKKVPGFKANDVKMVEWGKGSLKVNGVRQERFNGIRGEGIINLGTKNSQKFWDDDESDESNSSISDESSEEDSDSEEDSEEYYWPTGNRKKNSQKEILNVHTGRPVPNQGYGNRNGYGFGGYGNNRYAQRLPYNTPQRYDYQSRYQNRGRPFAMSSPPINNGNRMNYGNVMNRYGTTNSFNDGYNNKRRENNETKIGSQDFSGLGKQGLRVDFTDDGVLVNGKRAPKYDVGNQGVDVDMTGDVIKINGQEVREDYKGEKHYNDGGITIDGIRYPGQIKGKKGANQDIMGGGLTIDGEKIPGNVFGNQDIIIDRTINGLMINGRKVPGVNAYDSIEIDWNEKGGFAVNGEKKSGFEDIKGKGRTLLGSKLNPINIDGSKSNRGSKTDKNKQKKKDGWVTSGKNVGNVNSYNNNSNNVNWNNSFPLRNNNKNIPN